MRESICCTLYNTNFTPFWLISDQSMSAFRMISRIIVEKQSRSSLIWIWMQAVCMTLSLWSKVESAVTVVSEVARWRSNRAYEFGEESRNKKIVQIRYLQKVGSKWFISFLNILEMKRSKLERMSSNFLRVSLVTQKKISQIILYVIVTCNQYWNYVKAKVFQSHKCLCF